MAEDSDGTLKAVVICEGDLHDPDFPRKFRSLLGKLKSILDPPKRRERFLKVDKVSQKSLIQFKRICDRQLTTNACVLFSLLFSSG